MNEWERAPYVDSIERNYLKRFLFLYAISDMQFQLYCAEVTHYGKIKNKIKNCNGIFCINYP